MALDTSCTSTVPQPLTCLTLWSLWALLSEKLYLYSGNFYPDVFPLLSIVPYCPFIVEVTGP